MFVSMILDPIWQLYDAAVRDKNGVKAGRMAGKLGLDIPPRELASSDPRTVLQVRGGPVHPPSRSRCLLRRSLLDSSWSSSPVEG